MISRLVSRYAVWVVLVVGLVVSGLVYQQQVGSLSASEPGRFTAVTASCIEKQCSYGGKWVSDDGLRVLGKATFYGSKKPLAQGQTVRAYFPGKGTRVYAEESEGAFMLVLKYMLPIFLLVLVVAKFFNRIIKVGPPPSWDPSTGWTGRPDEVEGSPPDEEEPDRP